MQKKGALDKPHQNLVAFTHLFAKIQIRFFLSKT